jgi:putative aldouronate transport system substrate-binding protein
MKKQVRRMLGLLLCMMLVISMLGGCNKDDTSKTDSTGDKEGTSADSGSKEDAGSESTELEPVTLHFIFYGDKKAATDEVWDKIAEYTKDTLNATYDVQFIAGTDFTQKLLVKAGAGDAWDLNFDSDWTCYYQMTANDAYMAIDELLPKYAPDLYALYQEKGILDAAKSKGQIVSLPWTMAMNNRTFFQWRGDLVEKAGITVDKASLKTWEGVDAFLQQLKTAFPDKYILENAGIIGSQEGLMDIGHGLSINLNDPTCKVVPVETTQSYLDKAKYAEKWQSEGIIWKDILTDTTDHNTYINQGKLITKWGTHEFCNQKRAWLDEGAKWDFTEVYPDGLFANRSPLSNLVAIPATSENPERTLMFLNMLETDRTLYDMVQYGVLGETYELNGEEAIFPEGMTAENSSFMEWGGRWALWKPQYMRPDASYGEGFWQAEADYAASLPQNVNSPLNGFSFDVTNVKTQVAQRDQLYTDANKLIEAGLGGNYQDVVNKLISDTNNAGTADIIAECQKQIDAFLASK